MKSIAGLFLILLVAFCSSFTFQVNAQSLTIIDALRTPVPGTGRITISSDEYVSMLIGRRSYDNQDFLKLDGYRINAFSGRNSRESKAEATLKERQVKEAFPEVSTYVIYTPPIWRLRIGDFQTSEEATVFLRRLKKEFASFGREMFIVSDEIRIPMGM